MKLLKIFVFLLSLTTFKSFAQKGETVLLNVTYHFKHINDLNKPNKPYEEDMILRLGKTESRYNSWTDELKFKNPTPIKMSGGGSSGSSGTSKSGGTSSFIPMVFVDSKGIRDFELLQLTSTAKIVRFLTLGSYNYFVESELPKIDWKLYQEKKEILGYNCQKAVGVYAGRSYIAWFAPSLPFKNGPWKLSGLPGLILEAKDLKSEVSFVANAISKGNAEESTAARLTRITKVKVKDLERAIAAFEKDPVSFSHGQMPIGTSGKPQLTFMDKGNFYGGEQGKKLYDSYLKELRLSKRNPLELANAK